MENAMGKLVVGLGCLALMSNAFAQSAPPVQEINKQVIRAVTNYKSAISCSETKVEPKDIAALIPYKSSDDRLDATYAVLWTGDIGCAGGSGTEATHIALVTIGAGDSYLVDPLRSSPTASFDSPTQYIQRLVGNTRDTLVLEGKEHGPKDANCCPSIPVRFTLRLSDKGNWKLTEKKVLTTKK
jgi:hypothetical protein